MNDQKGMGIEGIGTKGSYHVDDATKDLSISHHKDTVEYNLHHAEDHLKAAQAAAKQLDDIGEKYSVPKALIDLFHFFDSRDDNAATMPLHKLRIKIEKKKGD